ncbi:MAG TPA: DUF3368 domain-containing protein [Thermoanaerobaculia bacterium]|nr:DUF3368 domain-containing protein [Thermoanaerobaculia bacterium]
MLVVADTSALVALAACDGLSLLDALFEAVRVPLEVLRECTVQGKAEAERLGLYLQGRVEEVDLSALVIAATGLGLGELEAMALYKKLHADRLLLDDRRARKVAQLNGIEVVGSIGVLLLAKERGLLSSVWSRLEAVERAGVHLSEALITEAMRLAGEV